MRDSSRSVAVVGGGSWGTALAIHLARAGFQVPLWAHDPERAHEMVAHRENRTYLADFRLPEGVHPSSDLEQVLRAWGRLDILANLVGGYAASAAAEGDLAAYRASWEQKVATAVTATAACIRPMRARGYGRIVSVASMAALKGEKGAAGYAMANAALVRWTESLAEETKREGITANVVLPRIIDTPENRAAMPKSDPSRWATPAEIAAVVVFLSSAEASGVTGAAIPVSART